MGAKPKKNAPRKRGRSRKSAILLEEMTRNAKAVTQEMLSIQTIDDWMRNFRSHTKLVPYHRDWDESFNQSWDN